MNTSIAANPRMRYSVSLLVVLMVLAATSRPWLVQCRVLPSPTKTEKTTHEPVVKELHFEKAKANTEYKMNSRVLIENQFHTMVSGPSRRGSGH